MKKHYRQENDCLNCGTTLEGKFCHNCGQENLQIKESFGHMMNHAISDYFHFDHQFFHTLKPMLFKPGYLTNEYMAGRRVHFLHPVKMYIFISIVYFLLLFQSGHEPVKFADIGKPASTAKILDSVNNEIDKDPNISVYYKKSLKRKIIEHSNLIINKNGSTDKKGKAEKDDKSFIHPTTNDTTYQQYLSSQGKLPENERDGFIERVYNRKALIYNKKYGPRAKEVFFDEIKHNIPKMMFLLLPLVALILMITFWRNKKYYVEHLIYTFHLHCFLFLFLAVIMLFQMALPESWGLNGWLSLFATLYIIWYLYRSLKVVYQRSTFRTITKLIGMSFTYFFTFLFCIVVVLMITALTVA